MLQEFGEPSWLSDLELDQEVQEDMYLERKQLGRIFVLRQELLISFSGSP